MRSSRPLLRLFESSTPAPRVTARHFHPKPSQTAFLRPPQSQSPLKTRTQIRQQQSQRRYESSSAFVKPSRPLTEQPSTQSSPAQQEPRAPEPQFDITFTCKPCKTRSTHRITHHGYYEGTVLIRCPGCSNRHLISDHLKIFSDKRVILEDIMCENGDLVKRGSLSGDGDMEFWDDGSRTMVKEEDRLRREGDSKGLVGINSNPMEGGRE